MSMSSNPWVTPECYSNAGGVYVSQDYASVWDTVSHCSTATYVDLGPDQDPQGTGNDQVRGWVENFVT